MEIGQDAIIETDAERKRRMSRERQNRYRALHPERVKAFQENWNKNNTERRLEINRKSQKKLRIENGDILRGQSRNRYKNVSPEKKQEMLKYWRNHYKDNYWSKIAYKARKRVEERGYDFNLTSLFLKNLATEFCPVYGMKLEYAGGMNNPSAAQLDRKNTSKGYTEDNVWFISQRANKLKSDASTQELKILVQKLEEHGIT